MASGMFTQIAFKRALIAGSSIGAMSFVVGSSSSAIHNDSQLGSSPAEIEFRKPYGYVECGKQLIKLPPGWTGETFKIRNNYPGMRGAAAVFREKETDPVDEMPWLKVDFRKDPELYCKIVKGYCYEGNVENDFRVEKNSVRDWYHAPWMHWSRYGREPIHGLTYERPTKPKELAESQRNWLQTWACGFYNHAGASAFGQIWKDPGDPKWEPFKFPEGTAVFKVLMTNATDEDLPFMKGAPEMQAVIAKQPDRTVPVDDVGDRNDFASTLRLLQVDFAVQDDRSEVGWVFGTFMYDGNQRSENGWNRITPIGIMWGNDPELNQEQYNKGKRPEECWINGQADGILKDLKGNRSFWGWNGRLNGPADDFRSACISCHSTAGWDEGDPRRTFKSGTTDDGAIMRFFRNLGRGEPFYADGKSADYSLQLSMGYANYIKWRNANAGVVGRAVIACRGTQQNREDRIADGRRSPLRET